MSNCNFLPWKLTYIQRYFFLLHTVKSYPFSQLQNYNNNGITYNKEKRLNPKLTQEVCNDNELEFEFCSENI